MRSIRMILNGKAEEDPRLQEAVGRVRAAGHRLTARVTREGGDAARLAAEAAAEGIEVVVAAGGDGTVNEVVNGLMQADAHLSLAVLPLGTANDFAGGCGIPAEPFEALLLAATGRAIPIDLVSANDRFFINVASGGFGARITATTPPELKRRLGGAAYVLMGFASLLRNPNPVKTELRVLEKRSADLFSSAPSATVARQEVVSRWHPKPCSMTVC